MSEVEVVNGPVNPQGRVLFGVFQEILQPEITDRGLAHLQGLAELEDLTVWGKGITDKGLVHLKKLTRLRHLFLAGVCVTEQGQKDLKKALPNAAIALTLDQDWRKLTNWGKGKRAGEK